MENSQKHVKTIFSHHSHDQNEQSILLPGLPNHLAQLCLISLPPSLLSSVCRSWRHLIYSPSFPPFFSLYALVSPTTSPENHHFDTINLFSFDPISSKWQHIPNHPWDPPLSLLHRHPSFISRNLPIQSVSVLGRLVIIAATDTLFRPALAHPLIFDPLSAQNHWAMGPMVEHPRRWCATWSRVGPRVGPALTGSDEGSVYVASGVGSRYHGDVARSLEKWDINKNEKKWEWEKLASLKDGRFSREAVEGVSYKGKIYMVNVKGSGSKQGGAYDVALDRWAEMPAGMLAGWNGPAGSGDDEKKMFLVDEKKGVLRQYNDEKDVWEEIFACCEYLKGAEQIAVGRGRVCVVCANGGRIVVVDVAEWKEREKAPRHWVVDPPPGMEVVSLHILPRMCVPEERYV